MAWNMPERTKLLTGFRLSEWLVKPEDGSISSTPSTTRLEPLLMELLVFLCSRAGQVVSKKDILDGVWGGRFVSDETVKGTLYQLRKALGDNPRQPRFIETLPKRGYRILVQPVPLDRAPDSEAHELYRKGRAALSGAPNPASLKQARLYFERCVQSDPENPGALSGLAYTYILMVSFGLGQAGEFLPRARMAALRAHELAPDLAEPHLALAVALFLEDHDFAGAEKEFRSAIQLDPSDPWTRCWYARFLSAHKRHDEAIAESRRALERDTLSLPMRRELLMTLFLARRYDETIAEAQHLFDIHPNMPDVHLGLVWVYYLLGQDRKAFEAFRTGIRLLGIAPPLIARAQDAFDQGGMPALFQLWIQVLEQEAAMGHAAQNDLLGLYALLGDKDRCFDLMERAYEGGNPYLMWLAVSPLFDNLRSDSRYSQFLERLGLSPLFPNQ